MSVFQGGLRDAASLPADGFITSLRSQVIKAEECGGSSGGRRRHADTGTAGELFATVMLK